MSERILSRELKGARKLLTLNKRFVVHPLYERFVHTLIAELAVAYDAQELPRPEVEPQIRWDFIATYLRSGAFDFCYDPYFLSSTRGDVVGVVQFGWIREVTVFVDRGSPLYADIIFSAKNKRGLRETLISLVEDYRAEIGVLGECAGSTEVIELLSDKLGVFSSIETIRDEVEMRWWIEVDPKRRIIVGDIGLVPMLRRVAPDQIVAQGRTLPKGFGLRDFAANDPLTRFAIAEPHPVGFITIRDERWESDIRKSFLRALLKHRADIPWEGDGPNTMTTMLADIGVEAMSLKELLKSLGKPELYELIRAEFDAVAREDLEGAAKYRDKIDEFCDRD